MEPKSQRKKLWWAVLASILVHLLVAYSLVAFNTAFPPPTPREEDEKPSELTVIDLSAAPEPEPSVTRPYLETSSANEAAPEPKEKTFQSSANSIAASELEAKGDAPLPSQNGKERPVLDFDTHDASLPLAGAAPLPTPPPPASSATPATTPKPRAAASALPQFTPLPEPSAAPSDERLAMLTGTPPPPIGDPEVEEAAPEVAPTPAQIAPRPLPERPSSAYRPDKQQTKISGRITNRGSSAADAVATPFGRYLKKVYESVGSRWYQYTDAQMDLLNVGTARVSCEVDPQGHIYNLRIISNDSNAAFGNICLQSFQEAQIPPIPPDLAATLPAGRFPVEITFTIYPPDNKIRINEP